MYIMITTRCNMECDHCCYSCTLEGEDMSLEVFRACLEHDDEYNAIGGGEPTIHPLFCQFIFEALSKGDVWLATNGKEKEIALTLARLAKRGIIGCDLSLDCFHEEISDEVVKAFTKDKREPYEGHYLHHNPHSPEPSRDLRGIRNVEDNIINSGRCDIGKDGCPCEEIVVRPNGDVYICGCEDAPKIGNVLEGFEVSHEWDYHECWKEQDDKLLTKLKEAAKSV